MQICMATVNIVRFLITLVVTIVREVVTTACSWVTTTLTTIREVSEKVCEWLPWPLDTLCNWVTKLIEVVETVTKWVCEEVIERIFDTIEVVLEYVFYVISWVCWIIDWIPRFFLDYLWCLFGVRPKKYMRICIKILSDGRGNHATTRERAEAIINSANDHFEQCNLELITVSVEFLANADAMTTASCSVKGFFSRNHVWFSENACQQPPGTFLVPITAYFVDSMASGSNACAMSRTNHVILTDGANGASLAHEIGHLADLMHHDDAQNIMYDTQSETKDTFTRHQCCMIRSSKYATLTGKINFGLSALRKAPVKSGCCGKR